jgi:hypothetical protein
MGWTEIQQIISELSEQAYSAGWMRQAEYDVWRLGVEGGSWGHLTSSEVEPQLRQLLHLAASEDYWVIQDEALGKERPVPLPNWRSRYRSWRNSLDIADGRQFERS